MTTSRYDAAHPLTMLQADGREVPYLRRRFLGFTGQAVVGREVIVAGDRVDLVAARTLDDPELSWLLADVSCVSRPSELNQVGRVVQIPTPLIGGGGRAL